MILDLFFSTKHEWKIRDGMGQSGEGDNMVRKVNCKLWVGRSRSSARTRRVKSSLLPPTSPGPFLTRRKIQE